MSVAIERIMAAHGFGVAIVGMTIVFSALAFISLFIAALPRILTVVSWIFPDASTRASEDDEKIVAAIGAVLHARKVGKTV